MKRRNALKLLGSVAVSLPFAFASSYSVKANDVIKPKVLREGDTVAIIAPATAVTDPEDIQRAEETISYFGLKAKYGNYLKLGSGYKTRTVGERLDDLHNAFKDKSIKAVFCIRGGYGSATLLDKIDYDLIHRNPKIFLAYSDITALHLAINKFAKLITFHGPVMLSPFSEFTERNLRKMLFSTEPVGTLSNPSTKNNFRQTHPVRTIKSGMARGILTGGNLTLISSLMGTPYEIDCKGKILLIEDVGEEPYRMDRMLTQLRLAGKLQSAAGIVFGKCSSCDYSGVYTSRIWDYSLGESIDNIMKDIEVPSFYGLMFGHTADQLTLPLGMEAEIDADAGTLTINDSALTE